MENLAYAQMVNDRNQGPKKFEKILDGFFLLYSCRVKIPSHAIRSKIGG